MATVSVTTFQVGLKEITQDGMLFLTGDDTDIDTLNETLVLPENMFAPEV